MKDQVGQCWFCEKHPATSGATERIALHTEATVLEHLGAVAYQKKVVTIPRCKKCKVVMSEESMRGFVGCIVGLGLGVAIGIGANAVIHWLNPYPGILLGTIGGIGCGFLVLNLLFMLRPHHRAMLRSNSMEFPEVKRLMDLGWKLGEKPGV